MDMEVKCNTIEEVRENIDRIDNEIIQLIAERSKYVSLASQFKKNEKEVKASGRVEEVIAKVRTKAIMYGADPDMIENLYREMINRFIQQEMKEFHHQQNNG